MARVAFKTVALALLVAAFLSGVFSQCAPGNCPSLSPRCPRTWNYTTAASWGSFCPAWSKCSSGLQQSPLDILPPVNRYGCKDSNLNLRYKQVQNFWLFNTGNYFTAPINKADGNTFIYQGVQYVLKQLVFHSPSDHRIQGKVYDLEIQFIHESPLASPKTLITSVFFQRGATPQPTNAFLEQIIYDVPEFSDCTCGNGRKESVNSPLVVGVSESCDEGPKNTNNPSTTTTDTCCRANCQAAKCGDGIVDLGEACDNGTGNANLPGTCRPTCCLPACGDGVVDPNEECDDHNRQNLDGCSSICKKECGDGELNLKNGIEQCDNGTSNSNVVPNACRLDCRLPWCGDGVTDAPTEQCDAGINGVNPSQCRGTCKAPVCGDGITDDNEDCDDADLNGPNYICSKNCTTNCGDNIVQNGEECDNGKLNSNKPDAACRSNCMKSRCGDGIVDQLAGEQCDSVYSQSPTDASQNIGGWWCDSKCQQRCGSGMNDSSSKQCDHGCYNADLPNRCRTNCKNPICGDGIVDVTEQCDNGVDNNNNIKDACRVNCVLPRCGDGVLDTNETCDDNNTLAGDGCDPTCRLECGNGNLEVSAGEECDNGPANANVADTCRTNCKRPYCGDGIVDTCEQCDDGKKNSNTAPNACRLDCSKPYCGDGIIDTLYGEKCDQGAANSDTAVDGCSLFCIPNYCRQRKVGRPTVDLALAVPKNKTAYEYAGSWSYPPCAENVQWLVFNEPQLMSDHQFNAFAGSPYGLWGSNRPIQNLGTRKIRRPCDAPPPKCGNGVQEAGEQCDLGALLNSDNQANRCRTNCRNPSCGDQTTDRNEECDDGAKGSRRCTAACTLKPRKVNPFTCPPWSYSKSCKWNLLCPVYAACASERAGSVQSPINIDTSAVQGAGRPLFGLPDFHYVPSSINFVNTGRSLALLIDGGSVLAGHTLVRIEFHAPSEHTYNGVHADLEAQLLHSNADGSSFVGVAILYNRGAPSPFLGQFDFYVPKFSDCSLNNGVIESVLEEECDDGFANNSNSRPDACRRNGKKPSCGDGVVDRGEQCDNGAKNSNGANTCKTNCLLPYCGDGFVDAGEECDPKGNPCCDKFCHRLCGNGLIDCAGEVCDDGPNNSDVVPGACRTTCKKASCGDGIIDAGEACDNGALNGNRPDACRPDCTLPKCGDGIVDLAWDEVCDLGTDKNGALSACLANCKPSCGSGLLPAGTAKQCDNGTLNANDDGQCRTDCTLPRCGDGILDKVSLGEQCDAGALNGVAVGRDAIKCSDKCQILCGNGKLDDGEDCDDGAKNDDAQPNACRTNCRKPSCGDGVLDANEECDFGSQNADKSGAPCRSSCTLPRFGDGIVDPSEQCDDKNLVNGDGCSATGLLECGNGRRDGLEECDNGADNAAAPNACRPVGYVAGSVDLSCKNPRCGDGIVDDGEQCDDGASNGLGPNQCRPTCTLPYCGDGVVDDLYGEACDASLSGDSPNSDFSTTGCSSTCVRNPCRSCSAPVNRKITWENAFLNGASPVATYTGSLTTPPCSEKVTWYVLTRPGTLSPSQLARFQTAIGAGNAREPQPLNGRKVSWTATSAPVCGNCIVEAGEECDSGDNNANLADKCRTSCSRPRCGDGILDSNEQCDNGPANSPQGPCNLQCNYVKSCPRVCTGPTCPACWGPTRGLNAVDTCAVEQVDNAGTIVNISFEKLLAGAGCKGPFCPSA